MQKAFKTVIITSVHGGRSSVWLERWIVAPEAVGSSPIARPKKLTEVKVVTANTS